jgi:hypothetical protein
MLKALDVGQITVPEACERYKVSERHVRRMLSAVRKGRTAPPPPIPTGPVVEQKPAGPPPPPSAPVPPTMADIDKALANGGVSGESKGPDPVLTAEMAIQGIRMAKMMAVITSAELMGVKFPDEKTLLKFCAVQPMTETVIRMQKPEAWAKLGELGSDPKALIGVLILDTLITGVMLYRMRPVPQEEDAK